MQPLLLKIALQSALRYVDVKKQPRLPILHSSDRVCVFLAKSYTPPSSDEHRVDVVLEPQRIVMHEYSADRTGDHYQTEFASLQGFVRGFVLRRIDIHTTDFAALQGMRAIVEEGRSLSTAESLALGKRFERERRMVLERFFTSWRFKLIRLVGHFNVSSKDIVALEPEA